MTRPTRYLLLMILCIVAVAVLVLRRTISPLRARL